MPQRSPLTKSRPNGQVPARRLVHSYRAIGLSRGHDDGPVAAHQHDRARVPAIWELLEADFHLAHAGGRIGLACSETKQAPAVDVAFNPVAVVHLSLAPFGGFPGGRVRKPSRIDKRPGVYDSQRAEVVCC
jgi:hypothetical protein